jgi:hypothetical protein
MQFLLVKCVTNMKSLQKSKFVGDYIFTLHYHKYQKGLKRILVEMSAILNHSLSL